MNQKNSYVKYVKGLTRLKVILQKRGLVVNSDVSMHKARKETKEKWKR